jgi:hypothetical protein
VIDRGDGRGAWCGVSGFVPYITAEPEVAVVHLDAGTDRFLILATDGLWERLGNDEAAEVVHAFMHAQAHTAQASAPSAHAGETNTTFFLYVGGARDGVLVLARPEGVRCGVVAWAGGESAMAGGHGNGNGSASEPGALRSASEALVEEVLAKVARQNRMTPKVGRWVGWYSVLVWVWAGGGRCWDSDR